MFDLSLYLMCTEADRCWEVPSGVYLGWSDDDRLQRDDKGGVLSDQG
jgi:hypothetical protein